MATTQMTPAAFVKSLRDEVMRHPAVTHPFLQRFAQGGLAPWQLWGYASQHYRLVCFFTAYLEALTKRTPDQEIRRLVQEILEEEYMRPQHFERSHPALYRRFMRAVGFQEAEWDQVPALPATQAFVVTHLDMTLRSWLETLGAVGPGHEWAIPHMFPPLVEGIERSMALDPSVASTGKAVDLKSTGPRGPWGFESLALRHKFKHLRYGPDGLGGVKNPNLCPKCAITFRVGGRLRVFSVPCQHRAP